MVDKVNPLKVESAASGGTETDILPTELDPAEDYVNAKGLTFETSDNYRIEKSGTQLGFVENAKALHTFSHLKIDTVNLGSDAVTYARVSTSSYTALRYHWFRGTNTLGTPSAIKFIYSASAAGVEGDMRLYDVTNAAVIATSANQTGDTVRIVTISSGMAWPANEAMIEIQLRRTVGGGTSQARLHSMSIIWE